MSYDPARRIVLAVAAMLAACSSDSPTDPGGGNPTPGPLAGDWVASIGVLTGTNATCRFPTVTFTLTQTGSSLGGSFESYGKGMCVIAGEAYAGGTPSGSVSGSVTDSVIQLTPSLPNFQLTAVVRGDSLIGTLTRTVTLSGGPFSSVSVSGPWRASRLPANLAAGAAAFIQVQPDLLVISQADSLKPTITVRNSARQGIPVQPAVTLSVADPTVVMVTPGGWIKANTHSTIFTVIARSGAAYSEAVGAITRRAARVEITPSSLTLHRTREAQLSARVLDYDGFQLAGTAVAFTSDNPTIAAVTTFGHVVSRGPLGKVVIRAQSGLLTDSVVATIVAVPVSMTLTQPTAIAMHDSLQLQVTVLDSVGLVIDTPAVAYASDLPAVISVSPTGGMVKSLGPDGVATITATVGGVVQKTRILSRSKPLPAIVATTTFPGMPYGLAISPSGAMYLGDVNGFGLYRGDLPGYDFPLRLPIGGEVLGVSFDPTGARAFIARDSLARVLVLDVATNQVVDSIVTPVMEVPVATGVSPDGNKLVVGTSNSVRVYDAHTLALIGAIPATGFTLHFAFDPIRPVVYASGDRPAMEIDLNTLTVLREFSNPQTPGRPQGLAVAPDGADLYVSVEGGAVVDYDLVTGGVRYIASAGGFGLALSASQDLLFAAGLTLDVVDRVSMIPIARLPVTGAPHIVAIDAAGTTVVVSNPAGWVNFIK